MIDMVSYNNFGHEKDNKNNCYKTIVGICNIIAILISTLIFIGLCIVYVWVLITFAVQTYKYCTYNEECSSDDYWATILKFNYPNENYISIVTNIYDNKNILIYDHYIFNITNDSFYRNLDYYKIDSIHKVCMKCEDGDDKMNFNFNGTYSETYDETYNETYNETYDDTYNNTDINKCFYWTSKLVIILTCGLVVSFVILISIILIGTRYYLWLGRLHEYSVGSS